MKLLLLAFLLLIATPAAAVTITDVSLNCAGTKLGAGVTFTDIGCGGIGLWLNARLTGWPVEEGPIVRFALALDGQDFAEQIRTLPADLGPCAACGPGAHYTGTSLGWHLPLEDCCLGQLVHAVASFEVIGGSDPSVEFDLALPTPEPATLLLLGTVLAGLGWRIRRGR